MKFKLSSPYKPTGDQPQAIQKLYDGIEQKKKYQTLLGVTGSGKTFTVANLIEKTQKPTLVIAHNKTLAAQLYQEFRDFFPNNAVSYFVSYYDYYQPEAYLPATDTYIEKEAQINDEIDRLRLSSTINLLTRPDVIVIASVSCIYNLGSPLEYGKNQFEIIEGELIPRESLLLQLTNLQYQRSHNELVRGSYRVRGDSLQLWPAYTEIAIQINLLEDQIDTFYFINPITGLKTEAPDHGYQNYPGERKRMVIFPAKHYIVDENKQKNAIQKIRQDLETRIKELEKEDKPLEAYRLKQKVSYDLEMIQEFGFVNGIENYSIYFDDRQTGDPPSTLIDYFHENIKRFKQDSFLTIVDESHITIPQIGGMHNGDRSRKQTLINYGFRLPSALDNRPLQFPEFDSKMKQMVCVSATPKEWEIEHSGNHVVEQLVRPTGLLDPELELRPIKNQVADLIIEIINRTAKKERTLVITLTKKQSEALTDYLNDEEKIKKIIKQYIKFQEGGEQTISVASLPNIRNINLGPIDDKFYTSAKPSKQTLSENPRMPKVAYLHSGIVTIERSEILRDFRKGVYDVLVGINLLREGLDLPEVTLMGILDADKAGFLRSSTALIQIIGRTARHSSGKAILYADTITAAEKQAITETLRRRKVQEKYNKEHGITPTTINKPIKKRLLKQKAKGKKGRGSSSQRKKDHSLFIQLSKKETIDINELTVTSLTPADKKKYIAKLTRKMKQAANDLDFELATILRDKVRELEK